MSHCSGGKPALKVAGGFGDPRVPTKEEQAVADKVKGEFTKQSGTTPKKFKAILVRSQVVAGTNYIFKVDTGDGNCAHIKVFEPLPHENKEPSLVAYKLNKKKDDKLENF